MEAAIKTMRVELARLSAAGAGLCSPIVMTLRLNGKEVGFGFVVQKAQRGLLYRGE